MGSALGAEFEVRPSDGFSLTSVHKQKDWRDVVLLDLRWLEMESEADHLGFRVLDQIRQVDPSTPVIVLLEDDDRTLLRRVLESGVYDTVSSPPDVLELRLVLRRAHRFHRVEKELQLLRSSQSSTESLGEMLVCSEAIQPVLSLARKVAPCDVSVLIAGETGTGKELLGRALHRLSQRATGPFVAFSCANLPETLIEDELFGHEKGAFTGAVAVRRGRFEIADQGTLFLDEIGDLALGLQAKLLRVLQQRSFERLGSNTPLNVNIRLICATHRNLEEMVAQGTFREDLYYRLNVVQLELPPLRERRDGIPVMAYHFLRRFAREFHKETRRFSPLAMHALEEYAWPGNVRELENVVQRAVVLAEERVVEIWHLPKALQNGFEQVAAGRSYDGEVREFKRRLLVRTLRDCEGNKAEAARLLGIARGYLHRLINQLQIQTEETPPFGDLPEKLEPALLVN
jgi:DNA-binding NtrC family response regulator